MVKLFIFNRYHNGDVIFMRTLVKQAMHYFNDIRLGCKKNSLYLLEDLGKRVYDLPRRGKFKSPKKYIRIDAHLAHIGDYLPRYGITYRNFAETFNYQMRDLGIKESVRVDLRPTVDFPFMDIPVPNDKSVIIENSRVRSKQSNYIFDLHLLSREFPDFTFYCSGDPRKYSRHTFDGDLPVNIVDCSSMNLIEISNLSNQCMTIVGRGSGISAACQTQVNKHKPRALVGWCLKINGKLLKYWDYPEMPLTFLQSDDDVINFLGDVGDKYGKN